MTDNPLEETPDLEGAELGKTYRVVVAYGEFHYYVIGVLRSKTMKWQGGRWWRLEGPFVHLIDPEEIIEIAEFKRRDMW